MNLKLGKQSNFLLKNKWVCFRSLTTFVLALYVFFFFAVNNACAATRTWDGDGLNNNVSTPANWDGDASAPVAGDDLVFTGSTRTSPVFDVAINYKSITVSAANFILTVNQNVALTGGMTIGNATTINVASSRTLSAATGVTFTEALTKTGAGTLTLSGSGSGSGGVKHETGTLNISHDSALGTGTLTIGATSGSTAVTFNTFATRAITNAIDIYQNFTFSGSANLSQSLGSVTLYITPTMTISGAVVTFAGVVDDGASTYGITKAGGGTLALSNANTYGGTTTVSAGVLRLNDTNALPGGIGSTGGTSGLTLSGGVIELGASDFNRGLGTGADQVQFTTASGFSAYGADRVVNLGGASEEVIWNSGSFVPTGSALILSSTVANYQITFQNPIDLAGEARTIQTNNGSATTDAVVAGVLRGTNGELVKTGVGTLQLTGANTYTGKTTIAAGSLSVSSLNSVTSPTPAGSSNLGAPSNESNGTISIGSTTTAAILIYTGTGELTDRVINLAGTTGGATIDQSGTNNLQFTSNFVANGNGAKTLSLIGSTAGTGQIDGVIVNSGSNTAVTKNGSGAWTLNGANTYDGLTTVTLGTLTLNGDNSGAAGNVTLTAGTLILGHDNALGSAAFAANGGSLQSTGGTRTVTNTTTLGGTLIISGSQSFIFNGTFTESTSRTLTNSLDAGQTLTLSGTIDLVNAGSTSRTLTIGGAGATIISGTIQNGGTSTAGGLTLNGAGATLTISGTNTYDGTTTLTLGTLTLSGDHTGAAGGVTLSAGTLIVTNNNALSIGTLALNGGSFQGTHDSFVVTNTTTMSGNPTISGSKSIEFSGTFTETNSYTLTNSLDSGKTLTLSGTVNLEDLASNETLTVAGSGTTVISGTIQNGGTAVTCGLTYTGTGTLTLSGVNTYTGATTVNSAAGILVLSGSNSSAGTTVLTTGTIQLGGASANPLASGALTLTTGTVQAINAGRTIGNTTTMGSAITISGSENLTFSGIFQESVSSTLSNNLDEANTLTLSGTINLSTGASSRTLTIAGSGNTVISGVIQNGGTATAGGLTLNGSGATLTLSGANTYGGTTTVTQGILTSGATDVIYTGGVTVSDTWNLAGYSEAGVGAIIVTGGSITTGGGSLTTTSTLAMTGGSINSGVGTFTLGGAVTGNASASTASIIGNLALGAATRTFTIADGAAAEDMTISANIIAGDGVGLTKAGAGEMILSGNNNYPVVTTISAGTLTLTGNNSSCAGGVTLTAGALNVNNVDALGTGTLTLTAGTIDNTTGGSITNAAANPITIGGSFTFGGTQDLNLGTGAITNASNRTITLSGASRTLTMGGTMTNTSNAIQTTTVNGTGNTLVLGGYDLSNNSTSRINVINGSGNVSITGVVANGGTATTSGLTYSGTGVLTLSGTNTYAGATTISTGTLIVGTNAPSGSNGALGNAISEVVLGTAGGNTNASILIGGAYTVERIIRIPTSNITDAGTRVITLGGNTADNSEFSGAIYLGTTSQAGKGITVTAASGGQVTISGVIQNPTSMDSTSYTVTKSGNGTVVYSTAHTYTGDTSISVGTLKMGINNGFLSTTTSITAGTTLDLAGYNLTSAGSTSFQNNGTIKLFGGETVTTPTNNTGSLVQYYGTSGPYTAKSWTYYNIQLSSSSSTSYTSPANFSATNNMTIDENNTFDASSATTVNVDGKITNNGALSAPAATTASAFTLGGDFENNGTFTHSSGRVTLDGNSGANNQTLSGSTATTSFYQLYVTAGGTRTIFFKDSNVYSIADNGTISLQGTASYQLIVTRNSTTDHWDLSVSNIGTTIDVDYTTASWSNAINKTMSVSSGTGNINGSDNINWLFAAALTTDIVDGNGNPVENPSVTLDSVPYSLAYQSTTGTLGISSQKIRVTTVSNDSWTLSIAASNPTDKWESSGTNYDFNDSTAGAEDGADSDSLGGQLSIDPSSGSLTGTCSTNLSKGSSSAFSEGSTDSITMLTATSGDMNCYVDITGINLSQTIPKEQPAASDYDINMVLTVTAF